MDCEFKNDEKPNESRIRYIGQKYVICWQKFDPQLKQLFIDLLPLLFKMRMHNLYFFNMKYGRSAWSRYDLRIFS